MPKTDSREIVSAMSCDDCSEHASLKDSYAQLLASRVRERAVAERMAQALSNLRQSYELHVYHGGLVVDEARRAYNEWKALR